MQAKFKLSLRPVCPEDEQFIFRVFVSSRPDFEWMPDTDSEMKPKLLRQQFTAEQEYFSTQFPCADYSIVLLDGEAIGRLYVFKKNKIWRLLSIALLPEYRNNGIGGELLSRVLSEAYKAGRDVRLQVAWYNQAALKLYKRHGFNVIEDIGPVCEMEWDCRKIQNGG